MARSYYNFKNNLISTQTNVIVPDNIFEEKNIPINDGVGIGENGDAYQLGGRNVEFKPKPVYQNQVEGKIVVLITVNRDGDVIHAIPGVKGSTTLNKQLLEKAKDAALKTKFNSKANAPSNQQGRIIYHFTLN